MTCKNKLSSCTRKKKRTRSYKTMDLLDREGLLESLTVVSVKRVTGAREIENELAERALGGHLLDEF
jgi:hypothetical protein